MNLDPNRKSKHLIDLRHIIPGIHSHKNIHKSGDSVKVNVSSFVERNNIQSVKNTNVGLMDSFAMKLNSIKNLKFSNSIVNFGLQLKSSLQFVLLTVSIFIMLFLLSNFSAYKQIIAYWYQDEILGTTQEETAVDKLVTSLSDQDIKSMIFDKEKISYVNFQVRPSDSRIYIPKINKNLPIVKVPDDNLVKSDWKGLEKDIQAGLRKGVVHYPGTAQVGEVGNMFLTAHSSWYPNDVLPYGLSSAFALLDKLIVGDKIYVFDKGEMYVYKIRDKFTVEPSDISVLDQPAGKREMTLMTCTPIGTAINRLIVKLDLIYPIMDNSSKDIENIRNLYEDGKLHA